MYDIALIDSEGETRTRLASQEQLDRAMENGKFRSAVERGKQQGFFSEQDLGAGELHGRDAKPSITLPPQETKEQPTLFGDLLGSESGSGDALLGGPQALRAAADWIAGMSNAYDRVSDAALQKLGMGRAFPRVERDDPNVAADLRELAAAPQYYRAKAEHIVEKLTAGMTREQEKGFVLLADKASRDWLRDNKPEEYQKYLRDDRISQALSDYKPHEEELRDKQKALGGPTIDEDYLRRVYAEHVGGVGAKNTKPEMVSPDRVITPQMANKRARSASPAYYYEHGLHEFGPSFATRYVATNLKLAEHHAAMRFLARATKIDPGDGLPPVLNYQGQSYYRADMARLIRESASDSPEGKQIAEELGLTQLPKPGDVREYSLYDPTPRDRSDYQAKTQAKLYQEAAERASGTKLTTEDFDNLLKRSASISYSQHPIYAGPKEIVEAFQNTNRDAVPGFIKSLADVLDPVTGMVRRQAIGFGFGIPHIANLMRRVTLVSPAGALDPRSWARATKVLFDKELKRRAISGVDDPAFAALLRHAGISDHGIEYYRDYLKGNLDGSTLERAWKVIKASKSDSVDFSKRLLSDIKTSAREGGVKGYAKAGATAAAGAVEAPIRPMLFMGHHVIFGPGGIDQRARLWLYDLIRSEEPSITDDAMAQRINMVLGRYNKASWTDFQKALRPFTFFPGWDYSSVEFNLKNPLRSWFPRAILFLLANQVLFHTGKNREKDSTDMRRIHVGKYSLSSNLFRESLGDSIGGAAMRYGQNALQGHKAERSTRDALSGIPADARAFTRMLNPLVAAPIEVSFGKELGTGRDIVPEKDRRKSGAPEKDWLWYASHKAFPGYTELAAPEQQDNAASFAGRNIGISIAKASRRHSQR